MPFPFSLSGTLEIHSPEETGLPAIAAAVADAIRNAEARSLTVTPEMIAFHAGMFRSVNNLNPLISITNGQIRFSQRGDLVLIHYRITFLQTLAFDALFTGFMFGFVAGASYYIIALGWLVLAIVNRAQANRRFPRLLRTAAEKGRDDAVAAIAASTNAE